MAHAQYDHCSNCLFWDYKKPRDDKRCKCKHTTFVDSDSFVLGKGWCDRHTRRDPFDKSDTAVRHDYIVTREILKAQGRKVKPLSEILPPQGDEQ